jgi:hypothetical protein
MNLLGDVKQAVSRDCSPAALQGLHLGRLYGLDGDDGGTTVVIVMVEVATLSDLTIVALLRSGDIELQPGGIIKLKMRAA